MKHIMDCRRSWTYLLLVFTVSFVMPFSACSLGYGVRIVVKGQPDQSAAINRIVQDLKILGFTEWREADNSQVLLAPMNSPNEFYSASISVLDSGAGIKVFYGIGGATCFSKAGVDLYGHLVEQLTSTFGLENLIAPSPELCK